MSSSMVGTLDIVLAANGDQVARTVDQVNSKLAQMATKAEAAARSVSASNQGAFTGLRAGVDGAADSYQTLSDATASFFAGQHTGWRILGSLAGGATEKMIEGIRKLAERAAGLPASIDAGFKPLIQAQYLANDSMGLVNATLANQAALLEHTPVNRAAVAMAETKVEVDKLATSLDAANALMEKTLSENHLSRWHHLIGYAGTASTEGTVRSFNDDLGDLAYQKQNAARSNDTTLAAELEKQYRSKLDAAHGEYQKKLTDLEGKQKLRKFGYEDNTANIRDLRAADTVVMNDQDAYKQGDANRQLKDRIGQAEANQRASAEIEKGKQEAYRKEMQTDEQHLADMRRTGKVTVGEELGFWSARRAAVEQGSAAYLDINKRVGELNQQAMREAAANAQKALEDQYRRQMQGYEQLLAGIQKSGELTPRTVEFFWGMMQASAEKGSLAWLDVNKRVGEAHQKEQRALREQINRDAEESFRALEEGQKGIDGMKRDQRGAAREDADASNEARAQRARNQATQESLAINEAVGRTMTRQAGALVQAATNTRAYGAELSRLKEQRKAIEGNAYLTQTEKAARLAEVDRGIVQQKAGRALQVQQDNFNINPPSTSVSVALRDSFDELARSSTNLGKNFDSLVMLSFSAVNQGIVRQFTEQHTRGQHIFGNIGSGIFKSVTGSALEGAEGSVLKLLHFGGSKAPKGTSGDPMYVKLADKLASGAAAAAGAVGGAISGGGFASGVKGILHALIPGFASGVSNFAGGWAMVGEAGPELLNLPRGSNVVPNHEIGDMMGGGGVHHTWNIDARGATDPAQVNAQIHQAMSTYLPHIVKASQSYSADQRRRSITKS